jgi:hypothetical protein
MLRSNYSGEGERLARRDIRAGERGAKDVQRGARSEGAFPTEGSGVGELQGFGGNRLGSRPVHREHVRKELRALPDQADRGSPGYSVGEGARGLGDGVSDTDSCQHRFMRLSIDGTGHCAECGQEISGIRVLVGGPQPPTRAAGCGVHSGADFKRLADVIEGIADRLLKGGELRPGDAALSMPEGTNRMEAFWAELDDLNSVVAILRAHAAVASG